MEKENVGKEMVKTLDVKLRCRYYTDMIQPDHPSDACASANS